MERYTIFFDWKSQYWYNDHTTQGNLQIQWNPYQITDGRFIELGQKNLILYGNTKDPE